MGTGNSAAHHFELLRSRDSSDPFNSRRGESRRNGLESPPELPATIPWASSWGKSGKRKAGADEIASHIAIIFRPLRLVPRLVTGPLGSRSML